MKSGKTSTFTIHHDTCKPETWTPKDILAFANFVRWGNLQYAATLARLGVQLILSEHHEPLGGTLQEIGWGPGDETPYEIAEDLDNLDVSEDVAPVRRIYAGPVVYAARFGIGDGEGNFESYEYEIKPTQEEAQAFLDSMKSEA